MAPFDLCAVPAMSMPLLVLEEFGAPRAAQQWHCNRPLKRNGLPPFGVNLPMTDAANHFKVLDSVLSPASKGKNVVQLQSLIIAAIITRRP